MAHIEYYQFNRAGYSHVKLRLHICHKVYALHQMAYASAYIFIENAAGTGIRACFVFF